MDREDEVVSEITARMAQVDIAEVRDSIADMREMMYYDIVSAIDIFVVLDLRGYNTEAVWAEFYDECGSELSLDNLSAMAVVFDPSSYRYSSLCWRIGEYLRSRAPAQND